MAQMEENIRRSEELQEILGRMPSWLIRWGTIVVFGILIIIITTFCLIKYPDTLPGNIVVTCENPPAKLIARSSGRIKLLFKDNAHVEKDDYVAIIENPSSTEEVLILKKNLPSYEGALNDPVLLIGKIDLPNSFSLGELQEFYNRFKTACEEYMLFVDLQRNHKVLLTDKEEKKKLEFRIKTTYQDLKTNFMFWQQKFALISPIEGKISLFNYWNNNQFVNTGDEVASIITNCDKIFGKLYVSGNKFGKVKKKQRVRIALDSYPASQYGVIFGEVESISEVNKDNLYAIHVALPDGLITNYKEKINFQHEMKGLGEIITEDLSLIERLFYQTRSLFLKRHVQKSKSY
jgi:multidrug efflux pump subunit AcrA (membrane-fusion protein)